LGLVTVETQFPKGGTGEEGKQLEGINGFHGTTLSMVKTSKVKKKKRWDFGKAKLDTPETNVQRKKGIKGPGGGNSSGRNTSIALRGKRRKLVFGRNKR